MRTTLGRKARAVAAKACDNERASWGTWVLGVMAAGDAADSAAACGAKRAPSPNPAAKAAVANVTEKTKVLLRMVCLFSFLLVCQGSPRCCGPSYANNRWREGFLPV
jgi:hypothetical protein